ncbi:hypothetical protein N7470_005059 [Penicillium chermesinum]|nr:hypothetical protein N7470_005059 [Penicillium chermesinum]
MDPALAVDPAPSTQFELRHPTALLWGYEMQRVTKELTERLVATKSQLEENEKLTRLMYQCLNDLIVILASITTELKNTSHSSRHRLQLYANAIEKKNKTLISCITELKDMYKREGTTAPTTAEASHDAETVDSHLHPSTDTAKVKVGKITLKVTDSTEASLAAQPMEVKLAAVMKQGLRSLEEYYESARVFRRSQRRLQQDNDKLFINAFIAGLDRSIYRRRITHWLKKERWEWAWLEHIIMVLILEEEHFEKQEYALTHRFSDGSVLLPDGMREPQFVVLSPITEEDLTESEGE